MVARDNKQTNQKMRDNDTETYINGKELFIAEQFSVQF